MSSLSHSGEETTPSSILFVIKQIEQATRAHLDTLLKPHGITAIQYATLTILERHGEMSSADLARRAFVRAQSMADMIAVLERIELVERREDVDNRRRSIISLTPRGSRLLTTVAAPVSHLESRMLGEIDPNRVDDLRHDLSACRRALERYPLEESRRVASSLRPGIQAPQA